MSAILNQMAAAQLLTEADTLLLPLVRSLDWREEAKEKGFVQYREGLITAYELISTLIETWM